MGKIKGEKKGQVFTPPSIVDIMVEKLFRKRYPKPDDSVLDPGCGTGAFINGILRWCKEKNISPPRIVGVESDPRLIDKAQKFLSENYENIALLNQNFLLEKFDYYDFIISNPPYLRIEELDESERKIYREKFETAVNRFDLYILFFEKALKNLAPSGRLVFITPEKYEYTLTTKPLRKLMSKYHIEEIHHINEDAFKGLVTYPSIITINHDKGRSTKIIHRDGTSMTVDLPTDGSRWISVIKGESELVESDIVLEDICLRVSCGVATGADRVFVMHEDKVPTNLRIYAHPTVSGKQLTPEGIKLSDIMLIPYDRSGLLPDEKLKEFKDWLSKYKDILNSRTCVTKGRRKWYAFHENPPMADILKPKILCKDISKDPKFWLDDGGEVIPRHSVYYIVPKNSDILLKLFDYLNSEESCKWLIAHCQRAANSFIRLQSSVLKKLPIVGSFITEAKLMEMKD